MARGELVDTLRTACLGLGAIGLATARLVHGRRSMELVGAADADPAKAGRDLGELLGLGSPTGVVVESDVEALLVRTRPEVVFLCTSSFLPEVAEDVRRAARAGARPMAPRPRQAVRRVSTSSPRAITRSTLLARVRGTRPVRSVGRS